MAVVWGEAPGKEWPSVAELSGALCPSCALQTWGCLSGLLPKKSAEP